MRIKKQGGGWVGGGGDEAGLRKRYQESRVLEAFVERLEEAYDLASCDPVELLVFMGAVGQDPLQEGVRLPLDIRLQCLTAAAPYFRARVKGNQVLELRDGGKVPSGVDAKLEDPRVRELVERLALDGELQ